MFAQLDGVGKRDFLDFERLRVLAADLDVETLELELLGASETLADGIDEGGKRRRLRALFQVDSLVLAAVAA